MGGFVYIVRTKDGFFKIGRTKHLSKRMAALKIQLPFDIGLAGVLPTCDEARTERLLHKHFAPSRKNGEWFKLSDKELEQLETLAFLYTEAATPETKQELADFWHEWGGVSVA